MSTRITRVPEILMPKKGTDLEKWSVIACDQYTSQPEYWNKADELIGDAPSTLRLTLPEVYLEEDDVMERTNTIHETMKTYLKDGLLEKLPKGVVLTERFSGADVPRRGIVISVDLDAYEYQSGSQSLIRPTEKTVVERIPPRLQVRKGASIELPHIMILIDDPDRSIIEPLFDQKDSFEVLYDTDLMQKGGHINGWFIPQGSVTDEIEEKLSHLGDRDIFNAKYNCTEEQALLPYAVGDGNHSMATAKAYWEEIKATLTPEEMESHPARYALVEIVNIHDESLIIEPIHRVMFNLEEQNLFDFLKAFYQENGASLSIDDKQLDGAHSFPYCTKNGKGILNVTNPKWAIPVATLQAALDAYLEAHTETKIDYIHGDDVVTDLGSKEGNLGLFLPDIAKNDLFKGVVFDGVLPRKTFSMGEAHEKRYYMESKMIVK